MGKEPGSTADAAPGASIVRDGPGRQFEQTVADLLSLSGFDVTRDRHIGPKKVDIVAQRDDFGHLRTYAVECKDHRRRLGKQLLLPIEAEYAELHRENRIDALLLVTRRGLTREAQYRVSQSRFLLHQTIDSLRCSLLDFRRYLADIRNEYRQQGLHRYYIPTRGVPEAGTTAPIDLEAFVDRWLDSEDSQSLAILGGYGAGKSTFMLHLANRYAARFQSGQCTRVPVLIPLREICSEQTVEGLIGRHFTHLLQVTGYNYGMFRELNRLGAFLLLLDGFDEMKHSMTSAVFRYNFREVLKLVPPQSKVILTGRPTAFLNESERKEFLHAIRSHKGVEIALEGRPDFSEVTLAAFDDEQIERFIDRYRSGLLSTPREEGAPPVPSKEDFFKSETIMEIARKPLQLRMLFDVLPLYSGSLDELTVRELFTLFVGLTIERESEEPALQRFPAPQRRAFLARLVFYMWHKEIGALRVDDIPEACYDSVTDCTNTEDVKRYLLSGAFVEIRFPGEVFFPHRSIQEFLIADLLLAFIQGDKCVEEFFARIQVRPHFGFVDERISPEIMDFLVAASGTDDRIRALLLLHEGDRALSTNTIRYWIERDDCIPRLKGTAKEGDVWSLALLVAGRLQRHWCQSEGDADDLYRAGIDCLLACRKNGRDRFVQALFLNWVLFSSEPAHIRRDSWLRKMVVCLLRHTELRTAHTRQGAVSGTIRPTFVKQMVEAMWPHEQQPDGQAKERKLPERLSLIGMKPLLMRSCAGRIGLSDWYVEASNRTSGVEVGEIVLHDSVGCTNEIQELLQKTFDEDMLNPKRRKGKKKRGRD